MTADRTASVLGVRAQSTLPTQAYVTHNPRNIIAAATTSTTTPTRIHSVRPRLPAAIACKSSPTAAPYSCSRCRHPMRRGAPH